MKITETFSWKYFVMIVWKLCNFYCKHICMEITRLVCMNMFLWLLLRVLGLDFVNELLTFCEWFPKKKIFCYLATHKLHVSICATLVQNLCTFLFFMFRSFNHVSILMVRAFLYPEGVKGVRGGGIKQCNWTEGKILIFSRTN